MKLEYPFGELRLEIEVSSSTSQEVDEHVKEMLIFVARGAMARIHDRLPDCEPAPTAFHQESALDSGDVTVRYEVWATFSVCVPLWVLNEEFAVLNRVVQQETAIHFCPDGPIPSGIFTYGKLANGEAATQQVSAEGMRNMLDLVFFGEGD